jgi:hypothetical protein
MQSPELLAEVPDPPLADRVDVLAEGAGLAERGFDSRPFSYSEPPFERSNLMPESLDRAMSVGQLGAQGRRGECPVICNGFVSSSSDGCHPGPIERDRAAAEDVGAERARLRFVAVEEWLGYTGLACDAGS